jgi:hypothetical protein
MISKEKKFIFIHNFKTGGTSIEKKLGHFDTLVRDVQDHRTIRDIELLTQRAHFIRMGFYALKVGKPKVSIKNFRTSLFPELTKSQYDSYYKFSFVRNSWARMFSWYANIMKDEVLRNSYGIEGLDYSYEQFLKEKIDHNTFSQLYFLTDRKGNIPMDFIGRFENLQADFDIVCNRLNIADPTLPKLLVRNYGHYTNNYTQKTKDMIYTLYKDEIDYFGFEFGE